MKQSVEKLLKDLKELRKLIKNEKGKQISKKELRMKAESIGEEWFSISSKFDLSITGLKTDYIELYNDSFRDLIKLSAPNNLKTSYLKTVNEIIKDFRDDIILPLHEKHTTKSSVNLLDEILNDILNPEENEYIKESVNCAKQGFYKASVVLGWCAAIHKIHIKIEHMGFTQFNVCSARLASQTQGRYKKFNSTQNISSLNELQEVFDTVILWIIEGLNLIDSNQHTRLRSCFDMRCQCAHPGEAPITEFNLMSYFSDLNEIVFKNLKFKIN